MEDGFLSLSDSHGSVCISKLGCPESKAYSENAKREDQRPGRGGRGGGGRDWLARESEQEDEEKRRDESQSRGRKSRTATRAERQRDGGQACRELVG